MATKDPSSTTAVISQPSKVILKTTSFGPAPQAHLCSICLNNVTTSVTYEIGACTWLACTGIFLVGGVLGCCVIPFFVDGCKNVHHTCPVCNNQLGVYKRC